MDIRGPMDTEYKWAGKSILVCDKKVANEGVAWHGVQLKEAMM